MSENLPQGLPENIHLRQYDDYIHITRKWFGSRAILMTFAAILINGVVYSLYLKISENSINTGDLIGISVVGSIGLFSAYFALANWLNKTDIFVSKENMEIRHKPIPWYGNKIFPVITIEQIYCKERIKSTGHGGFSVSYEVRYITKRGEDKILLSQIEKNEQALYIEQEVEKYLGIENQPVRGGLN